MITGCERTRSPGHTDTRRSEGLKGHGYMALEVYDVQMDEAHVDHVQKNVKAPMGRTAVALLDGNESWRNTRR